MKRLLLSLFLLLNTLSYGQTLIAYNYIETGNWSGGWGVGCGPCWYSTNVFVSSTSSAALIGSGNGGSNVESGTYSLTNITGLSSTSTYMFKFRAGSYKINNPTAITAGTDSPDYFDVRYSSNNGTSWKTEMRITGINPNGSGGTLWNYNTNAIASKIANGLMTIYSPIAGGDRTSTGDGYSIIELTLPIGVTQLRFEIPSRVNSDGEEWWFDNFELIRVYSLPIELINFDATNQNTYNLLTWSSATEHNNDYYLVERSTDGFNWSVVNNQNGAGNSTSKIDYSFRDFTYEAAINYYRLTQVDIDGQSETFKTISLNNLGKTKEVLYFTNLLGQIVNDDVKGNLIVHYTDGTTERIYR
jgi:hypothetical protein